MLISFDDFNLLENFIDDTNFSMLLEKNLSNKIDDSIKFGIVLPTYKIKEDMGVNNARAKYTNSIKVLTDSITSIKNQTYKNWVLYIVGDAYEGDQEVKDLLSSLLKPEQYKYHNLSKPGERDSNITAEEKRFTGGIAAMNKGLSMCKSDGLNYIARIDHDDKWKPNHLELIAKAYTQFPNTAFIFTKARKKVDAGNSDKTYFFFPQKDKILDINNKGYVKGETAHASVSWRTDLTGNFKYRNVEDQKNTEPKNKETLPGDVDMFTRMMKHIKDKEYNYMYIPKLTTFIRNRKGKF